MSNINQKETKLAPIFELKTNNIKEKANDRSDGNKRKRKKKSPKIENKTRTKKKINKSCGVFESNETDYRRSNRLRNKVTANKTEFNYNEDTDEELFICEQQFENSENIADKLNESIILLEDNSNTIDYWNDYKSGQDLQIDSTDEDIEVIPSDNSKLSSQSSQVKVVSPNPQSDEQKECLLWTEKYKPTNSSEIIGHKVAANRLKIWLEDWGKCDTKKDWLEIEDDSDNCLDETNACLLICGPTGSGKTSMVYAIAEELKYEILELNASMKRNGRMISKILGEASQSHQMQRNNDSNGSMQSIQSFFSCVTNRNDIQIIKQNKKSKPKGILNYFSKQSEKSVKNSSKNPEIELIEEKVVKNETQTKSDSVLKTSDRSNDCSLFAPKALSIATNSLILFDDIDVMIDDDFIGFWNAFNRINEMTKKPVILTATQYVPYINNCVNRLQILTLNKPNASETVEGLKRIYNKELSVTEDASDSTDSQQICEYLSIAYDYDIRRCLNQLQFGTNCQHIEPQNKVLNDKKLDFTSYYDSLLFADIMQTQFKILSYSQSRDNWMKCKPTFIENYSQSITIAKEMVETINGLNYNKINKRSAELKELSKPIDSEAIDSISQYLSPNINLRTLLMDYCPYLSFICESESVRQSKIANHSRRSRRFMHHLDSIGLYIDNVVKTQLISAFVSQESKKILENNSEEPVYGHKLDDYFYE